MRNAGISGISSLLFIFTGFAGTEFAKGGAHQLLQGVEIREVGDKAKEKVRVTGEVGKVGPIEWTKNMTLRKAIEQAGGFTELANRRKVRVTRKGKTTIYDLGKGEGPKLLPGDEIKVPERWF